MTLQAGQVFLVDAQNYILKRYSCNDFTLQARQTVLVDAQNYNSKSIFEMKN